jgi:hemolysin D
VRAAILVGQGFHFIQEGVRQIALDQRKADGRTVDLGPGMAVTAEVKTGSRRIVGYLLSPVARYEHDVLRER